MSGEEDIEAERRHADDMAETLRMLSRWMQDSDKAVIAVSGSQVTVGMVVEGQLAVHDLKRLREDDRILPRSL